MTQKTYLAVSKTLRTVLFLALAAFIYLYNSTPPLPELEDIDVELKLEPNQTSISEEPYEFHYKGADYVIEPVAKYEISGLIVSHNDIHSLFDMYHDSASVDIKDICIIWGENIQSDVYQQLEFYSEPWTCFYRYEDRELRDRFNPSQLSNTHVLSDDPEVREAIMEARVGDQIYMKGTLINYYHAERPDFVRKTSTIREDTGQGACEVMMVDAFEVIKENDASMLTFLALSKWALIILGSTYLVIFIWHTLFAR